MIKSQHKIFHQHKTPIWRYSQTAPKTLLTLCRGAKATIKILPAVQPCTRVHIGRRDWCLGYHHENTPQRHMAGSWAGEGGGREEPDYGWSMNEKRGGQGRRVNISIRNLQIFANRLVPRAVSPCDPNGSPSRCPFRQYVRGDFLHPYPAHLHTREAHGIKTTDDLLGRLPPKKSPQRDG